MPGVDDYGAVCAEGPSVTELPPEASLIATPEAEDPALAGASALGSDAASGTDPSAGVDAAAVREALARLVESDDFRTSPQLSTILRFVVEATLDGRREAIKGYTIAVEALGRDPSFDPQVDPIVRVEATRLRRALQRYYAGAGAGEDIEIVIPRGSYVPQFVPRRPAVAGAPAPSDLAAPVVEAETAVQAPASAGRAVVAPAAVAAAVGGSRPGLLARARHWAGIALVLAVLLLSFSVAFDVFDASGWRALVSSLGLAPIERHNRLGIPMVEVRTFDNVHSVTAAAMVSNAGAGSEAGGEFPARALEVRIRDALARFDLLDVLASPDARPALSCNGSGAPNSAFALAGLVESHDDASVSLLLRLSDLCDGTIVWSREFDALRRTDDPTAVENELVREIMASLAEPYGVIQARARARVMSTGGPAAAGPYGCVLLAYDYWRSYLPADHATARDCLEAAVRADGTFALGYALLAELYLDEIRNGANPRANPPALNRALAAAEQAVELSPTSGYFRRVSLDVHSFRGERGSALAQGDIALQLNPYDVDTLADYGGRLISFGEVARGEVMLETALKVAPAMPPSIDYFRVLAAYLHGNGPAAAAAADRLMGDGFAPGLLARALASQMNGEAAAAKADVKRLVALVPAWKAEPDAMLAAFFPDPAVARRVGADLATLGLGRPGP